MLRLPSMSLTNIPISKDLHDRTSIQEEALATRSSIPGKARPMMIGTSQWITSNPGRFFYLIVDNIDKDWLRFHHCNAFICKI